MWSDQALNARTRASWTALRIVALDRAAERESPRPIPGRFTGRALRPIVNP